MYIVVKKFKSGGTLYVPGTIIPDVKKLKLWRCLVSEKKVLLIPPLEQRAVFGEFLLRRYGIQFLPPENTDAKVPKPDIQAAPNASKKGTVAKAPIKVIKPKEVK